MNLTNQEKNILIKDIWCNQLNFIANYNNNCKKLLDDIKKDLDKEEEIHRIIDPFIGIHGMEHSNNSNYEFDLFFVSGKPNNIMYTFIDWHEIANNKIIGGTRIDVSIINLSADIMKKINDYKSLLFKYCMFPKWNDTIMINCISACNQYPELQGNKRDKKLEKIANDTTKQYLLLTKNK